MKWFWGIQRNRIFLLCTWNWNWGILSYLFNKFCWNRDAEKTVLLFRASQTNVLTSKKLEFFTFQLPIGFSSSPKIKLSFYVFFNCTKPHNFSKSTYKKKYSPNNGEKNPPVVVFILLVIINNKFSVSMEKFPLINC